METTDDQRCSGTCGVAATGIPPFARHAGVRCSLKRVQWTHATCRFGFLTPQVMFQVAQKVLLLCPVANVSGFVCWGAFGYLLKRPL